MKCNPLRWLWALPVIALIWWLAQQGERARIETDLKTRTMTALAAAGQHWATTGFVGRDGWIRGKAFDEADQTRAIDAVRKTRGVRLVEDRSTLADVEKNFNWTASLDGKRVVLSGFVPSERDRAAVVAAVKAAVSGRDVVDEMRAARGAPKRDVWLGGVTFALRQLARLASGGRVSLAGTRLTVEGEALDMPAYTTVRSALAGRLPTGIALAAERVSPPVVRPFTWQARLTSGQIELSGHAPNEAARDALLARAKAMLPSAAIVDRIAIAAGAPESWVEAATSMLVELARLEKGEARLSDTAATFTGETEKEENARAVARNVRERLPRGYAVTPNVRFREPEIPLQQPFETQIVVETETVTVTGFVANEEQRKALIEQVAERLPGRRVVGRLRFARGQPEGWKACMQAGIEGLAALLTGSSTLVDRNLKVTGVTDDEDVAEKLPGVIRAAANRACQDEVAITLNAPPEPDFEWRAKRNGDDIVMDGLVTDSATKAALLETARKLFPNHKVTDRTRVAPAKSRKWPRVASSALAMLARLRDGEAVIARQVLRITGTAPDTAVVTAIANQLRSGLVKGYRGEDSLAVRSDAMLWAEQEARRKAEADARRAAEDQARREADERRRQAEADADARRRAAEEEARRAAEERRRQAEAQAETRRRAAEEEARRAAEERRRQAEAQAETRRRAAEEEARRAVEQRRRQAEAEERQRREEVERQRLAVIRETRRKEAERCQTELNKAASAGVIRFARASAEIERASHSTLDALVGVAKTCPGFRIEVEGHTDAEGTDERNQRLSDRRASSVADYLARAGVERDRIKAVGYGASRPVADNATADGRARNRRIEFKVLAD
ncbi:MAG: OmpA family protein [Hyphomicrobiaceae bacterium]